MIVGNGALWAADTSIPIEELTVGAALLAQALERPNTDALRWLDGGDVRSMSYSELARQATARAREILTAAVPGDRVAVWAPNSIDWVVLEYASSLAGTVLVPMNPALLDREVEDALGESGVAVLYSVEESRGKPLLERARQIAARIPAVAAVVDLRARVSEASGPLPSVQPTDPFLIQFTSGTTGIPKGAVLTHRTAYNAARMYGLLLRAEDEHHVSCAPLPFHHVAGSVSRVLGALAVGGTLVVLPSADLTELAEAMVACGVTHGGLLGKLATDLLENPDLLARFEGHRMRTVAMGGAGTAPELIRRVEAALGVRVVNGYGQSESPHITLTLPDDSDDDRWHTIGRPVPQREVCILRPDGSLAALGETGEICTRGPLVMDGYLGLDAATEEVFAGGWLHTGDFGAMDARGYIRFAGRVRDVIIRGGENIYPTEVEDRLTEHPEIIEVVVVPVPDARWGEQVFAYVRLVPGSALDEAGLRAFGRSVLAPFKVPTYWQVVEDFPRTAIGKVRKPELAQAAAEVTAASSVDAAAQT